MSRDLRDDRLENLDDGPLRCRALRHTWYVNHDVITARRGVRIVEIRRTYRCENGCGTLRIEDIDVIRWERPRKPRYVYEDAYRLLGERVDPRALRRAYVTRTSETLRDGAKTKSEVEG